MKPATRAILSPLSGPQAKAQGYIRVTEPYNTTQARDEEFLHRFIADLRRDRRIEFLVIQDEDHKELVTVWRKNVKSKAWSRLERAEY